MIKYIATDLDGTLFYPLDKKNLVHKDNILFVRNFVNNGGKMILCSGRSIEYAERVAVKLGVHCDIVGNNGALIKCGEKLIREEYIEQDVVKKIIEYAKPFRFLSVCLFTQDGIYSTFKHRIMNHRITNWFYYRFQGAYSEKLKLHKREYKNAIKNIKISKILFFVGFSDKKILMAESISKILKKEFKNLEVEWSKQTIEVVPKGCTKGKALNEYCKFLKIKKSEVAVIGDSGNDIPMFEEFYENSYCMSLAPISVKQKAKYILTNFKDLSRYIYKK